MTLDSGVTSLGKPGLARYNPGPGYSVGSREKLSGIRE